MSEIVTVFNNETDKDLEDISLDLAEIQEYFDVEGDLRISSLKPGMKMEKRFRIKPKIEKGVLPLNIHLRSKSGTVTKEYKIKVGGAEVY